MLILLFERGEFSRADAALTGVILGLMVPSIILNRIASVAQTLFYANMDMRTPFISDLIFTFSHTVLAILLVKLLGIFGLPIAVSLAPLSATIYIMVKLQSRVGPIGWGELRNFAWRLCATCAVAVIGFSLGTGLTRIITVSYSLAKVLDFAVPTALSIFAFTTAAFLFQLLDVNIIRHRQ
jgi:putative peptidoglycan lipid II flippase